METGNYSEKYNEIFAHKLSTIFMVIFYAFVLLCLLIVLFANPPEACACSRDIAQLDPILQEKINVLRIRAAEQEVRFKVICGFRTQEEQNRLFAKGRTLPGKKVTWVKRSKHTTGNAVDVAIITSKGVSWKGSDYTLIGKLGKDLGLIWGGDWKVRDYGHFELGLKG